MLRSQCNKTRGNISIFDLEDGSQFLDLQQEVGRQSKIVNLHKVETVKEGR